MMRHRGKVHHQVAAFEHANWCRVCVYTRVHAHVCMNMRV